MKATVGESQRTKPGEEARLPTVASDWITGGKEKEAKTPGQGFGYVVNLRHR